MREIGILGGTFDPIHNGHIKLAQNAYSQYALDEVWFMPSPNPPHKQDRIVTDYDDRCHMVDLSIEDKKDFICSRFENSSKGLSYTSDTLAKLHAIYPDIHINFIIGADSLVSLPTWHDPDKIIKLCRLLVASRDYKGTYHDLQKTVDTYISQYNADICIIDADEVDISSEHLRDMIASGRYKSASKYIPEKAFDYIIEHKLYRRIDA